MDRHVVLTRHDPDQKRLRSNYPTSTLGTRRSSPQDKTYAEEYYYRKQMQNRTPMVIKMAGGEELRGVIEWYDRDCLKVHSDGGPNMLLMKRYIVAIYKAEEAPRPRRKST